KSDKEFLNNIEHLDISIGNELIYKNAEEIKKLPLKTAQINANGKTISYWGIQIKDFKIYNGILNHFCNLFLSFFYNFKLFLTSYFLLLGAFLVFLLNKEKYNFSFNKKYAIIFILFLAFILRINSICYYPLWLDEMYTKNIAIKTLYSTFQDPGNPPLFFLLEYLFTRIIGTSDFTLRFLPLAFSFGTIYLVYKLLKNISQNFAIFGAFFFSINVVLIYLAKEARGYSMFIFLSILGIFALFQYIKNPTRKNLVLNFISTILLINSSYYLILLSFCNFIWGVIHLQNKDRIKFLFSYVLALITIIPYFIISFKNAVSNSFNSWILPVNFETLNYIVNQFFINKIIFVAFIALILFNLFFKNFKIDKNKKELLKYLVFTTTLCVILIIVISITIKPILNKRPLLSLFGNLALIQAILITSVFEIKKITYYIVSLIIFITAINSNKIMNTQEEINLGGYFDFIQKDFSKYQKENYSIHVIVPMDERLYHFNYNEINIHSQNVLSGKINDRYNTQNKSVTYYSAIGNTLDLKDKVYTSNLTPFAVKIKE
ncbi:glycosyltransferase family 39 protein, partial [bacterium]|nr:glycosyltransferase family 39 protein [bacterium]